jgi:hypothetical protein
VILRDFQIMSPPALADREREFNHRLFPLYEAVRLDLKARRPKAPFQKIVVSFANVNTCPDVFVMNCLGICQVRVPVEVEEVLSSSYDIHRIVAHVERGLEAIARTEGFSDPAIMTVLNRSSDSDPPCSHLLASLTRKAKGPVQCETWFLARSGHSAVEVRVVGAGWERQVRVRETAGPLFLEDDFPVRSARIRDDRYDLLDRDRGILASVDLTPSVEPA